MAYGESQGIKLNRKDLEKSRKKTCNKWFETQDSIGYWEDFSQQKIVWKRIGSILRFSYDNKGCLCLDSTCFASGKHIEYLVAVLNSKMGHYLLREAPKTGTGDLLISVQAVEPLKIPILNDESEFYTLGNEILRKQNNHQETLDLEEKLDHKIYKLYALSDEEVMFVQNGCF